MILVTLGTQKQEFNRLLDAIENLDTNEEIIVQAGGSKDYKSKKMKIFELISYDEMNDLLDKADLVITHGGTGSIISPLKKGKKIIACPRLSKYGEHVDDHQTQVVSSFVDLGYIMEFNDGDDLNKLFEESKNFKPQKFISNKDKFIERLVNNI